MGSVRILIADDSRTYRSILARVVSEIDGAEIVGEAENGREALELSAKLEPDLVLLDLEMPVLSGLPALERFRSEQPDVSVVVVSSWSQAGGAMKALSAGALEVVRKPEGSDALDSLRNAIRRVVATIERLRRDRSRPSPSAPSVPAPVAKAKADPMTAFDLVVIAVSTGGPEALKEVIPKLPASFEVPVLVVQHLPRGFMGELARNLDSLGGLPVSVTTDGEELPERGVRIAEGGVQVELRRASRAARGYRIWHNDGPRVHGCRPAADVLFKSVAREFEGRVLSVVMTGMGCDGRDGVAEIGRDRGHTIVQDEATSTIYGMPRAVADAGLADEQLPLDQIASRMQELVSGV